MLLIALIATLVNAAAHGALILQPPLLGFRSAPPPEGRHRAATEKVLDNRSN